MNVLVTGGSGFIGSHVIECLLRKGHTVTAFDRTLAKNHRDDIKYFIGDIRDAGAVDQAVMASDVVLHLAGILGTAETLEHIKETADVNIIGTLNVFEAVKKYSSKCVYITLPDVWENPYSVTKRCASDFAGVYRKEFGTKISVLRAFNLYGERQKTGPVRKFAPSFIMRAIHGEPLQVFGDGEQLMDLTYAGDVAAVLLRAVESDHIPDEIVDISDGEAVTVLDVVRMIIKAVGEGEIEHLPMRKGETSKAVIKGDYELLRKHYGEFKFSDHEESFKKTVDWYDKNYR